MKRWTKEEDNLLQSFSHLNSNQGSEEYIKKAREMGLPVRSFYSVKNRRVDKGWYKDENYSFWSQDEEKLLDILYEQYPIHSIPFIYQQKAKKKRMKIRSLRAIRKKLYKRHRKGISNQTKQLINYSNYRFTTKEISELINCSVENVLRWVEIGWIKGKKNSKSPLSPWTIEKDAIANFARARTDRFYNANIDALEYLFKEDYPDILRLILEGKDKNCDRKRIINLETGEIFDSIKIAVQNSFYSDSTIRRHCNGEVKRRKLWDYL